MNLSASLVKSSAKPIAAVRIVPYSSSTQRLPKHLVLLIDTSGSMEGERMDAVKRTIHLLVDAMPDGDTLSLICYSSYGTIVMNASLITSDRTSLHEIVNSLQAGGGTNLESGILQLTSLMAATPVDSVFLLTDGHINEGITSSIGLLRILGSSSQSLPSLNTLGYGADYNSRTLKQLSVKTRGSHTYADAAELIPAIIGDIVGGLAAEIGKNGKLTIPDGWHCLELGYEDGDACYNVGSLIRDKEQWIVLEGNAPNVAFPSSLEFSWTSDKDNTVHFLVDDCISAQEISEQLNRTRVSRIFEEVTDLLEHGNQDLAKSYLINLIAELGSSISKDRPFVIRLLAQIDEMLEELNKPSGCCEYGRQNTFSPDLIPRMISNQVALGIQRGIVSRLQSVQPQSPPSEYGSLPNPAGRTLTGILDSFCSPTQRQASATMTQHYSQHIE
jgi:uncharacterized protein YegL